MVVFYPRYELILADHEHLGAISWATMLIDEAHRLKNVESALHQRLSAFRTAHRVLVTGTPLQVLFLLPKAQFY